MSLNQMIYKFMASRFSLNCTQPYLSELNFY